MNLEAGYEVVRRIKKHVASTSRPGVMLATSALEGCSTFSALNEGAGARKRHRRRGAPSSSWLSRWTIKHDTIGTTPWPCVNDVLAQGAEPLEFRTTWPWAATNPRSSRGHRRRSPTAAGRRKKGEMPRCRAVRRGASTTSPDSRWGVWRSRSRSTARRSRRATCSWARFERRALQRLSASVRKIVADNCLNLRESYPELSNKLLDEVLLTPTKST